MQSEDGAGQGLTLRGWYLLARNRAAIIVLHGAGCNRMCVWEMAQMFNKNGYGALILDLRAHGDSDGDTYRAGWKDVTAAVAYLRGRRDVDHIGVWGFSLGGIAAIQGAARSPAVEAVVADGAGITTLSEYPTPNTLVDWLYVPFDIAFFTNWALQSGEPLMPTTQAIAQLGSRPVMLIGTGGEGPNRFELNCTYQLYNAAREPKTLWIIPNIGHGTGFKTYPQAYEQKVIGFFNQALRLPSATLF